MDSLEDLVAAEGPQTLERAVELMLPALESLDEMHQQSRVHRDVRPGNVTLGVGRTRLIGKVDDDARSLRTLRMSDSLEYRPPEFFSGTGHVHLDESSDVYGAIATLFFLLAGQPPFGRVGADRDEYLEKILAGQADSTKMLEMQEQSRVEIDRVLAAGLHHERARRPSAQELADDLRRIVRRERRLRIGWGRMSISIPAALLPVVLIIAVVAAATVGNIFLADPESDAIWDIAVADRGRIIAGGEPGVVEIWNQQRPPERVSQVAGLDHGAPVRALVVLSDGDVASAGDDGMVRVWDLYGEQQVASLDHGAPVRALVVLSDGDVASAGDDGMVRVWDLYGEQQVASLDHGAPVRALVVLSDGDVASAGDDGMVRVWDLYGEQQVASLDHGAPVRALVVLSDGDVASAGDDGMVRVWDLYGEQQVASLDHGAPVRALVVLSDGDVASAGDDGMVRVWDLYGEQQVASLDHGAPVRALVVLSDGDVASAGDDGMVSIP